MNTQPAIPDRLRDSLLDELEACGYSQPDRMAVWGCVVALWSAELARLRRIEAAAREVLASGQARYIAIVDGLEDALDEYVGDLVPADAMIALREAVEGAALPNALPPRCECPDCESPTGTRGMCDRHFDALVELVRRA